MYPNFVLPQFRKVCIVIAHLVLLDSHQQDDIGQCEKSGKETVTSALIMPLYYLARARGFVLAPLFISIRAT